MKAWNVCLNGKIIDTVFYDDDSTAEEVKQGLVDHDGYDPEITVRDDLPTCPHCNDDIFSLEAFVLEENKYAVSLSQRTPHILVWSTSDVVESSEVRTVYRCGNCEEELFTVMANDDPQIVIDFIKGVRMIWVQDVLHDELYSELKRFNEQHKGVDGSYYGHGFPRGQYVASAAQILTTKPLSSPGFGIYFVDPTSSARGMDPCE